ncbi:MAG: DUF983 domain-containing protein [Pseudomonadota bacterium]
MPETEPSISRAALFGLCPHCGAKTLFGAPAQIADHCRACGYDFASVERGGRLAGLVTIIVAILLFAIAAGVDALFRPPIAVQMAIWAPVTIGCVLYALRFYKTLFLYAGYERAREVAEDTKP